MAWYRKKLVAVEAYQITHETRWNSSEWPHWMRTALEQGIIYNLLGDDFLYIQTLEGDHRVSYKDWVIKGVEGELYPCKPSIFKKTYEKVEEGI